jgi:hypothetical protein
MDVMYYINSNIEAGSDMYQTKNILDVLMSSLLA